MTEDEHLEIHYELCKRIFLRLKAEGNLEKALEQVAVPKKATNSTTFKD